MNEWINEYIYILYTRVYSTFGVWFSTLVPRCVPMMNLERLNVVCHSLIITMILTHDHWKHWYYSMFCHG